MSNCSTLFILRHPALRDNSISGVRFVKEARQRTATGKPRSIGISVVWVVSVGISKRGCLLFPRTKKTAHTPSSVLSALSIPHNEQLTLSSYLVKFHVFILVSFILISLFFTVIFRFIFCPSNSHSANQTLSCITKLKSHGKMTGHLLLMTKP